MSAAHGSDEPDDDSPTGVFVRQATNAPPSGRPAHRSQAAQGQIRDSEMLTVKEAADLLRVNIKTVYAEIAAGRLKHVQLGRRIIRIPRSVIASLPSKSA